MQSYVDLLLEGFEAEVYLGFRLEGFGIQGRGDFKLWEICTAPGDIGCMLRLMTLKPEPQALDPAATCLLGLRLGFNPEALKPAPKTVNKWKLKKANLVRLHPLRKVRVLSVESTLAYGMRFRASGRSIQVWSGGSAPTCTRNHA